MFIITKNSNLICKRSFLFISGSVWWIVSAGRRRVLNTVRIKRRPITKKKIEENENYKTFRIHLLNIHNSKLHIQSSLSTQLWSHKAVSHETGLLWLLAYLCTKLTFHKTENREEAFIVPQTQLTYDAILSLWYLLLCDISQHRHSKLSRRLLRCIRSNFPTNRPFVTPHGSQPLLQWPWQTRRLCIRTE